MNPSGPRFRRPLTLPIGPRRRESWAGRTGIALSALLHLLILVSLHSFFRGDPSYRVPPGSPDRELRLTAGMELVEILEVAETQPVPIVESPPQVETPPQPDPEPAAAPPEAADAIRAPLEETGAGGGEEVDGLTVAERLQPQLGDPRIWMPIPREFANISEFERAEILLLAMLQSWNDSLAVAEALSDRARDWTYTDGEGRRWGLAPGRLYLGDFSIPLPAFSFDAARAPNDPSGTRQWTLDDLTRGAAGAAIQDTWTQRARAIRERMEAERAQPNP